MPPGCGGRQGSTGVSPLDSLWVGEAHSDHLSGNRPVIEVRAAATPQAGAATIPGTRLSGARGLHTDNQLCWAVEKGSLAASTGVKAGAACWRPLWQNQPEREGTGLWTE